MHLFSAFFSDLASFWFFLLIVLEKANNVSESDLLFLIPNNVKRMHGLPLTRISGKKKRKQKEQRKRFILSFKLFDIIEDIIEETLCSKWSDNEFFNEFVEVKNLNIGDKNILKV